MNIQIIEPLSRAWNRMKKALFQPFDLGKWFTVGFTAFLATLMDYHGGGNASNKYSEHADWDTFFNFPGIAREWLLEHTFWLTFIIFGIILVLALIFVFTWLSSRGKFMFLYNVVYDEAEVLKPWQEFRREGNSLFIWRLIYGFICFAAVISFLAYAFLTFRELYYTDALPSITRLGHHRYDLPVYPDTRSHWVYLFIS
ncbi:MAG: hypothetical protein JW731_13140 [Bacteroidales bacterium]|nr:hypothetical protein [Bacteroidales bacterium]